MKIMITRKKAFAGFLIPYACVLLDSSGRSISETLIKNGETVTIEADERTVRLVAVTETSTGTAESEPFELPKNAELVQLTLVTHYSMTKGSSLGLVPLDNTD